MKTTIRLPELLNQPLDVIAREVLTALLAQQAYAVANRGNGNVGCRYNTEDGRHCAAGLALPDGCFPKEGHSIGALATEFGWVDALTTPPGLEMLGYLQRLHDRTAYLAEGVAPSTRADMHKQLMHTLSVIKEERHTNVVDLDIIEQVLLELA